MVTECVVVGAGPAGLAASVALSERGIDHLVVERARVGETWRTQRWDSLHLNHLGFMNTMLGEQEPNSYLTAGEVVERLEALASKTPLRTAVTVHGLTRVGEHWIVGTSDGPIEARTVVVASGGENVPRTPSWAARLPERIVQCHAASYTNSGELPEGAVLVVGSAQSGMQITEDLLAAGRRVWLATSPVGRAPARYRGKGIYQWLDEAGFFEHRPEDLPDPSVIRAVPPLLGPGGRDISLQLLARAGANLAGRLVAVRDETLTFDDSLAANVAYGDKFVADLRRALDAYITDHDVTAPGPEPDTGSQTVVLNAPRQLSLGHADIGSVIWGTGYTGDFRWLGPDLIDSEGIALRRGAASPAPGIWFVGLRWLIRRTSGNFIGFPRDAAVVADSVHTYLALSGSRPAHQTPTRADDLRF
ncbi:MAG: NAD(P)/FAD-dependent oxidoreductase [Cryobacterium sp.]|uniref:flavin-containing monooxygenase n=1 Tax=Cryobacterium sp. TaxID=1926290 RepID=UPI002298B97C|nr:NAD(P)/FAD-dependent oxidoreductase [Cryobacterium sp.]MCY7405082.1 NAD(P)/FAD-dependent oxidoreductase [Cryobacterium sp.]